MSKYNYLNLNQKMIKIRKKLPALIRKRYSEDVDYDFVKLDDINQFLTPALNRYGVDFDIVREIPTQVSPAGNPTFLTLDGNLWRYEADLEICWTNADRPQEKITSTLHLIGTNDVADKAKGTAMTYGLKYYLLNKFNIPQNGEDDPDMKGKRPDEGGKQERAATNGNGRKQEAAKTKTGRENSGYASATETDRSAGAFQTEAGLAEGLKEDETSSSAGCEPEKPVRNGDAVSSDAGGRAEKPVPNGNAVSSDAGGKAEKPVPNGNAVSSDAGGKMEKSARNGISVSSDAEGRTEKIVRSGNAVSSRAGMEKDSASDQHSRIHPIKMEKKGTVPDAEHRTEPGQEKQVSSLTKAERFSEESGKKAPSVIETAKQEELDFMEDTEDDVSGEYDTGDGFCAVEDEAEVPFPDSPDEEEYGQEESDPQEEDGVEQAKAVICNFGLYKGQTLGQMLETQKGWESLKWIASRYNGANREMKEAAAVLVQAAAYEAKAA